MRTRSSLAPVACARVLVFGLALLVAASLSACGGSNGGSGSTPPPAGGQPPPGDPNLVVGAYDPLPGVVATAISTTGGSGPGGRFLPGDLVTVQFTLMSTGGDTLDLTLFDSAAAYLSGPTHNYNRVIPSQGDVRTTSLYLGNATWQYTFPVPLPAVYAAPYNDTPSFGTLEGELTGQPLQDGTYTLGIELSTLYEIDFETKRDAGALLVDILVGSGSTTITPRSVVSDAHCNQCHTDVQGHGGRRKGVGLCLLCHTSGAEDKNDPMIEGGTPGVSVDFRVMIHKLHNGHHLPSVLGVTTKLDGTGDRDYLATPVPYKLVGFNVFDASEIGFPVFPSLTTTMPRDAGFSALSSAAQGQEDEIRRGVVACAKCHGDPDGTGPIQTPPQGDLHELQPSRHACGSCHDDVVWSQPYKANNAIMPANPGSCTGCHPASGVGGWPVREGHLHPLVDPAFNPGLSFDVSAVSEAGIHDDDGTLDPGEKVAVTMTCTNDDGSPVLPSTVSSISCVIAGPTANYNLLLSTSVPITHPGLAGPGPVYVFNVPSANVLELVGTNTGAAGQAFGPTQRTPHLNLAAAPTAVRTRGANPVGGGVSVAVNALSAQQNYIDVVNVMGFNGQVASPTVVEFICVEEAPNVANREYVQVKWVQGSRLWLNTPLRNAHPAGCSVVEVTLTSRATPATWTLNAATGVITEDAADFGADGDVLVDYWSDYVVPATYPPPLNDSPDLGETVGEWQGKSLASGTYSLDIYGAINRTLNLQGESNSYRGTSVAGLKDFLVGDAAVVEPYDLISEAANCYACHDDVYFHGGGRRSFETCIMCHGDAGAEDRSRYTSPNGPDTPLVSISFREMLHKIHMGRELTNAATWTVAGNNGSSNTYGHVGFPPQPGGVMQCVKCHGNDAWHAPLNRDHPTEQVVPVRSWKFVCGSCHDSAAAQAHIDVQTSPSGIESCAVCHGELRDKDVVKVHFPR
jgi:OmcA/MtrC family decaheme c-type cytochrome